MTSVALTYFKRSGKYYSKADYESLNEYAFEVYQETREMMNAHVLPGLTEGHSDFAVLVEPSMSAPQLLIPKNWIK